MEQKRRADVINATLTCISLHGIEGMTLDKVAEYAHCSKGVVTYYFKNKDHLTTEAFKSFLAYYGLKIESGIEPAMSAEEMMEVVLQHMLPPFSEDTDQKLNVSQLDGVDKMFIPYEDQGKLFVQFFQKPCWTVICRKLHPRVTSAISKASPRLWNTVTGRGRCRLKIPTVPPMA